MEFRDLVGGAVVRVLDLNHVVELEVEPGVRRDRDWDLRNRVTDRLSGGFSFGNEVIAGCDIERLVFILNYSAG